MIENFDINKYQQHNYHKSIQDFLSRGYVKKMNGYLKDSKLLSFNDALDKTLQSWGSFFKTPAFIRSYGNQFSRTYTVSDLWDYNINKYAGIMERTTTARRGKTCVSNAMLNAIYHMTRFGEYDKVYIDDNTKLFMVDFPTKHGYIPIELHAAAIMLVNSKPFIDLMQKWRKSNRHLAYALDKYVYNGRPKYHIAFSPMSYAYSVLMRNQVYIKHRELTTAPGLTHDQAFKVIGKWLMDNVIASPITIIITLNSKKLKRHFSHAINIVGALNERWPFHDLNIDAPKFGSYFPYDYLIVQDNYINQKDYFRNKDADRSYFPNQSSHHGYSVVGPDWLKSLLLMTEKKVGWKVDVLTYCDIRNIVENAYDAKWSFKKRDWPLGVWRYIDKSRGKTSIA